jgi:hypothetical protein
MAVRIPQNQIITNQYTSGGEYVLVGNQKEYQGYYYEMNGKTFASKGKDEKPNPSDSEIIKRNSEKYNKLLDNPTTYVYGMISGIKINNFIPTSTIYNYNSDVRYFTYLTTKKTIKEVNEDTFNQIQTNPVYTSVKLNFVSGFKENELKEAEKKIPGITDFINTSYTPPPVEEDGTVG